MQLFYNKLEADDQIFYLILLLYKRMTLPDEEQTHI